VEVKYWQPQAGVILWKTEVDWERVLEKAILTTILGKKLMDKIKSKSKFASR
jgi:hypothetical protein